jgi:4'-phosphopantetheinyl transferase EntD
MRPAYCPRHLRRNDVIEEILPPEVTAEEAFSDEGSALFQLFPEERAIIARAVTSRRREFATVRQCARAALKQLGIPPTPLTPGDGRAPTWPLGVVGSMTHCPGYRAAATARESRVRAVGIDAEVSAPLPDGVLESIALPHERSMVNRLGGRDDAVPWGRLLFSCKEAVYKVWFPLTKRSLEFDGAEIDIDPTGTFSACFLEKGMPARGSGLAGVPRRISGRWMQRDGLILTGIALPT